MATSDLVSVRGQVMEYTYIPTGIKGEMVRSGMDCHNKLSVLEFNQLSLQCFDKKIFIHLEFFKSTREV